MDVRNRVSGLTKTDKESDSKFQRERQGINQLSKEY